MIKKIIAFILSGIVINAAPTTGTVEIRQYNGTGWVPNQVLPVGNSTLTFNNALLPIADGNVRATGRVVISPSSSLGAQVIINGNTTSPAYIDFSSLGSPSNVPGPATGDIRVYESSSHDLAWYPGGMFNVTLAGNTVTASRVYTLPDIAGTVILSNNPASSVIGNIATISNSGNIAITASGGSITISPSSNVVIGGSGAFVANSSIQSQNQLSTQSTGSAGSPMFKFNLVGTNTSGIFGGTSPANFVAVSANGTESARWYDSTLNSKQVNLGPMVLMNYTVSGLPAAATIGAGATAYVTDSVATITTGIGLAPTGGGSNKVPVFSDGTTWRIYE